MRSAGRTLGADARITAVLRAARLAHRTTGLQGTSMAQHLRLIEAREPETWSEEDFKALSRENPRQAMDMVIRRYRERLYYHALYIVKGADEAYDIVQEVFIRAIREPRFFDDDFRIRAWLFRVTSNLCFNQVRDRNRRGAILDAAPREESARANQLESVFDTEQRSEVMAAIEKLTEEHKDILLLRYYDDLSYAEIAETLGIKLGTVMSRLSRARTRLAEVIGQPLPA